MSSNKNLAKQTRIGLIASDIAITIFKLESEGLKSLSGINNLVNKAAQSLS